MSNFKEALGAKKFVAIIIAISTILAFSTFSIFENSRKEEKQSQLALEQQRLNEVQRGHQSKVCGSFGNSLNLLTESKLSSKKLRETNSILSQNLQAWSVDTGESNGIYSKLSKYRAILEQALAQSSPKKSKEFLEFQESNFNYLIRACGLDNLYTYPSTLTFLSGCNWESKNLRVELQMKNSSNSWTSISTKNAQKTQHCDENPNFGWDWYYGADFSITSGLMRNNLKSYGTYRVKWSFKDGQKFVDGKREIYSCTLSASQPDQILYPAFQAYQHVLGCDGEGNPDYVEEPDIEEVPSGSDPWSRDWNSPWEEETAKFTWCWNLGLQYSLEEDACY